MSTLDLGEVQRARVTTNHQAAREGHLRQAIQAAFGDRARAIRDTLTTFKVLLQYRVVLHALELIKRADVWVAVRQIRNQADNNLVIFSVIQEKTTG